ncbi:polyhydroxyalkanoate granule-associated phasin [Brachymonas chironomi]|uniref:polyhydroxyalkanoate granule-associated phasin n=1 Tax=Brachymonas chironomi TaxID=491919 RepID=UPI000370528E|nr:polyhydroxyalkanoate granule-associated phasin [Brachymonas chironomi]
MSPATQRKVNQLARQTAQLSAATPQVIAHRVGRMATSGIAPRADDLQEFNRMYVEKVAAFSESWQAMGLQAMQSQFRMMSTWMGAFARPGNWMHPWAGNAQLSEQWQKSMLDIMSSGMKPVHGRAVANARRLGGRRR